MYFNTIQVILAYLWTGKKDERGLSQSTENAILLAGAAAIATIVVTVITAYVTKSLPK